MGRGRLNTIEKTNYITSTSSAKGKFLTWALWTLNNCTQKLGENKIAIISFYYGALLMETQK